MRISTAAPLAGSPLPLRFPRRFRCAIEWSPVSERGRNEVLGRDLFHPIRLSLAGRPGEGELDRVILLVDEAAALPFAVPIKSVRTRILDFCSALD